MDIETLPCLRDNYIYLLRDPASGLVGAVDPAEPEPVQRALDARGWTLSAIFITHHHADHIGGIHALKQRHGARVFAPQSELARVPEVDVGVGEGDRVALGSLSGLVLETPGHTSGHIAFWFEAGRALFCGDTLFSLGCGRMFEGTPEQMWASLCKLRALPDDTLVCCAHEYTQSNAAFARSVDPGNPALQVRAAEVDQLRAQGRPTVPSRLGVERLANPFLRADDPELQRSAGLTGLDPVAAFAALRGRKDRF